MYCGNIQKAIDAAEQKGSGLWDYPLYTAPSACLPVVHYVWQGDMGWIHKEFSKDFKHRMCMPYGLKGIC